MIKSTSHRFHCSRCGACCRHIQYGGSMYKWLLDDKGQCRYFDELQSSCTIYPIRPLICRVEEGYILFASQFSFDEYILQNSLACAKLQELQDKK